MRNKFGESIYNIMKKNHKVMLILVDSGTDEIIHIRNEMPDRIIECGISEANAIGVAAGMASENYIPIIYGMAPFLAYRAFEFIRDDICLQNRHVVIVGSGGGLGYNNLGPTHHSTEDIAVMTALPDMTVLSPATPLEVNPIMKAAIECPGPVYIRFGKAFEEECFSIEPQFEIGKSQVICDGDDVVVFTTGSMLPDAVRCHNKLSKENICVCVINISSIKPLDVDLIINSVKKCKNVVTVEEHNAYGGLGQIISALIARAGLQANIKNICLQDEYCFDYGWRQTIRAKYGLSENGIENEIRKLVKTK